ncbi:biotin/lipoyl-containing protein [Gaopeijia maritima]|uniref:Biotin/lipoyl-containing protein n=1 Tax=Gaopeijia maritima TaxID=3119007 RepID=A0ABU9EAT0_9BACT
MMRYSVTMNGQSWEIDVDDDGVTVDGERVDAALTSVPGTSVHALRLGTASHRVIAERGADGVWGLDVDGRPAEVEVVDERTRRLREMVVAAGGADGPRPLKAPMPGLVVKVEVEEGQVVEPGDGLVIVEAMKMENELRAEVPARVSKVLVAAGDTVEKDQVLVELVAPEDDEE